MQHTSDCATHNFPAYPPEPCDCGADDGTANHMLADDLRAMANACEAMERHMHALETLTFDLCRELSCTCVNGACPSAAGHPSPFRAEHCGCAMTARDRFAKQLAMTQLSGIPG